jgi:hypothetical protein
MRYGWIGLVLVAAMLAPPATEAKTWRFDMGTDKSPLRDGFTRVTARSLYAGQAGFGWESAEGLAEHEKHYGRQWVRNEGRGRDQPPPIYTNEVTCDCVIGTKPNRFLVDLPDGHYRVYLLCGRSAGSPREYHDFDASVAGAEGPIAATVRIPGPYRFEKRLLAAAVRGGRLAVELRPRTDWLMAGLIVFPASDEAAVRKELLDPLEQEVYFLPPDVAATWKETKHADDRPMPELSPADRRRGYAIFARHWSDVVYPNTVPRPEELDPRLETFASPGEYEPVALTVRPLRNLAGARLTAGDLRSDGAVIPAARVEVRAVRTMFVRPNYSTFNSYHVAPDVLEKRESVDLAQGCNQRFWITIHVPDDAKPGTYEGNLVLTAAGTEPAAVPLRLRVLPIRLQKNPEHVYGVYYHDPLSNVDEGNTPQANEYFRRKAELERRDMVEHGMNSHTSHVTGLERDAQGHWTMNGAETERRIALDRQHGLAEDLSENRRGRLPRREDRGAAAGLPIGSKKPLVVSFPVGWWYEKLVDRRGLGSHLRLVRPDVPQSFFDEVTRMVEAIEREKRKYDWPEFLYYPIDEPSPEENSVRFMVGVLKAIKRAPGVRTYVTADPSHDQFAPMWPYVDVWCCQPFVFDCETIRRMSREKKIEFWCYPNHVSGENDHTPVRGARMTWGFGFWRSGFRALIPWIYQSDVGDPWNYLDGSAMDFMNRSTAEGEPVPVALWEAYREGIDDGRYVYTLEQLAAEAQRRGGRAAELAAEGEKELRCVWEAVRVREKYKEDDGLWSGADFDAYRWLMASKIVAIQEALR